jgi:hypothetical protein
MASEINLDENVNFKEVFSQGLADALGYKRTPVMLVDDSGSENIFDMFATINDERATNYMNNMDIKEQEAVNGLITKNDNSALNIPRFYMILNSYGIVDRLTRFQMLLYLTQGTTFGDTYSCVYYNIIPENIYFGGIKPGMDGLRFTVESSIESKYFGNDKENFNVNINGSTILIKDDKIIQTNSRTYTLSYILSATETEKRFGVANIDMTCRIDYKTNDVKFLWKIKWRNDAIKNFMDLIKKLYERNKAVDKSLLTIMCILLFKDGYYSETQQQNLVDIFEGICVKYSGNDTREDRLRELTNLMSRPGIDLDILLTKYKTNYNRKLSDPLIPDIVSNQMNRIGDIVEDKICGQVAKCPEIVSGDGEDEGKGGDGGGGSAPTPILATQGPPPGGPPPPPPPPPP